MSNNSCKKAKILRAAKKARKGRTVAEQRQEEALRMQQVDHQRHEAQRRHNALAGSWAR